MIEASHNSATNINDNDIKEEVDTIMFEVSKINHYNTIVKFYCNDI